MYARAHTRTRLVNFSTTDHQLRITTYHIASYNGGQKIFKWVIDHQSTTHQYPFLPIQSPLQHHSLLLDNNRDSTFYDRPYCSLCLYNITQHLAKRWKTPLPNVRKYFYQRWKTLLSTLDNTFIKRWIILENNIVVYTTARFPGICVNCKCYCIYFFYLCQQLCSVHRPNNTTLVL